MFHSPWVLLLLIGLPLLGWRMFGRHRSSVRYSSVSLLGQLRPTVRQRMLWIPKTLSLLAAALLIVSLARPREGNERTVIDVEGIAIQLVVDRSGSMQAMDFELNERPVDRLTAIKNVATKFIRGGRTSTAEPSIEEILANESVGRYSDLIGLITFAGYADAVTPATLDHQFLIENLAETEFAFERNEAGTAIGDAIALAAQKLTALDDRQAEPIKNKIIILLTDGENTAGDLEPIEAAELAESLGIKVYTIGVGSRGRAPFPFVDRFSGRTVMRAVQVNIDEETLNRVSEITGGQYFRATDTQSLQAIYDEVDKLEKSKVEARRLTDFRELAVRPFQFGWFQLPPLLLLAFVCLAGRVILENTWLRRTV